MYYAEPLPFWPPRDTDVMVRPVLFAIILFFIFCPILLPAPLRELPWCVMIFLYKHVRCCYNRFLYIDMIIPFLNNRIRYGAFRILWWKIYTSRFDCMDNTASFSDSLTSKRIRLPFFCDCRQKICNRERCAGLDTFDKIICCNTLFINGLWTYTACWHPFVLKKYCFLYVKTYTVTNSFAYGYEFHPVRLRTFFSTVTAGVVTVGKYISARLRIYS